MFYDFEHESALRFGDVIGGFIAVRPSMDQPMLGSSPADFRLDIKVPHYLVILSPCCSIKDQVLSLVPLKPVVGSFFDNPYFASDLTNVNRQMLPEQTVSPEIWSRLSTEEKEKRLREGLGYAFVSQFVYEQNDYFSPYEVRSRKGEKINTRYYMIDFRDAFVVGCSKVNSAKDSPIGMKILQLSLDTRQELRQKIAAYYSRIPAEDLALMGAV